MADKKEFKEEEEEEEKDYDLRLQGPFSMMCVGPSNCGKTSFIFSLIRHANEMITPQPEVIYYCYGEWQKEFENFPQVNFLKGFDPDLVSKENLLNKGHVVLILDDLVDSLLKSDILGPLWTRISHHRLVSPIILMQNLYCKGLKSLTDLSRNSTYKVIFKSPGDKLASMMLGRSLYPGQATFWKEVFEDATKDPHSYIFIDSRAETPEILRLRAKIFPGEETVCYTPKEKKG